MTESLATARVGITGDAVIDIIRRLVAELRPGEPVRVSLDSLLEHDLGLDSLGRVELLARLEQVLGLSLPQHTFIAAETPRDLLRALTTAGVEAPVPVSSAPSPAKGSVALPEQAQTLIDVLDWHARTVPDRTHIFLLNEKLEAERITYRALRAGADAVASGLQGRGLMRGETVALMLPTGRDYFFSFFGVLRAGGVPVPIYPPLRAAQIEEHLRRHARILVNAQAKFLITVPDARVVAWLFRSLVPTMRAITTTEELASASAKPEAAVLHGGDTALLQYTSGSTGNPKGVILTHANLLASIRTMGAAVEASARDVFVSWMPLYHDMGLIGAWLASLYFGMRLVVMSPLAYLLHPREWLWAIDRYRGTISGGPNFGYEFCLRRIEDRELQGLDLSSWRVAVNGAEPVMPQTIARFSERFARYGFRPEAMFPVYGLAECTLGLSFPPLGRAPIIDRILRDPFVCQGRAIPAPPEDATAQHFVSCGRVLPGHEVRIVDTTGFEASDRQEGRIQFRGPAATTGYYRNADETAKLFVGEWCDSGDLGYYADGELYLTGRVKDVIIRRGRSIYPHELEEAIGNISGVRKGCVVVFGAHSPIEGTEKLVVVVETRETNSVKREQLRAAINAVTIEIAGAVPDDIVFASPQTVLKTSSGKIRRAACRELYEQRRLGRRLAAPWQQVLRLAAAAAVPQWYRARRVTTELLDASYLWLVTALFALPVWLAVALSPRPSFSRRIVRVAARWYIRICCISLTVHGHQHLPRGPCVLVANHASYVDAIVLCAVLPARFSFVAKREFAHQFFAGVFLKRLGAQFVERFNVKQSTADALRLMDSAREHQSLMFFAEGTFYRMPGLLPFHLGAFEAAAEAGLPTVPIALRGTRALLRSDQWFPRRSRVTVTIGEPIVPQGSGWSTAVRLRAAARAAILRHCGEPDLAPNE